MTSLRLCQKLWASWKDEKGSVNQTEDLLCWIQEENCRIRAVLNRNKLSESPYWFYDGAKSIVTNRNSSFFTINGIQGIFSDGRPFEQPIILQNEVGYLGVICKEINGELQFLMQGKIEPGNVNNVQISPTIQATASNFTQKHGGRKPNYLDYFSDVNKYQVIYDGEEPEQCGRFLGKLNRNVVIFVSDDVPVLPNFKWMSIGQIKYLACHFSNLVNMDTRTVLACLPYELGLDPDFLSPLFVSLFEGDSSDNLYLELAQYREKSVFRRELVRLDQLKKWVVSDDGMLCREDYPFEVRYFDINIQGREVTHWTQPLIVARGKALFGLFVVRCNSSLRFLIRIKEEIGCIKVANFGPTVQLESCEIQEKRFGSIESLFLERLKRRQAILADTILSEEGGRFYHEENQNVLIAIDRKDLPDQLPKGYFLVSYRTIRQLIAKFHCLNIQLRDLISLLGSNL